MATSTTPTETTVQWETIISLDHVSDSSTKEDIAAMLDKIEASPTGQKVLNNISANLMSDELYDGQFKGQKLNITDSGDIGTMAAYLDGDKLPLIYGPNASLDGDSVVVNFNGKQVDNIEIIATNGQPVKMSPESALLHELAHVADGEGLEARQEVAYETLHLQKTITTTLEEVIDVNSELHKTLTPEQQEAAIVIKESMDQLGSMMGGQQGEEPTDWQEAVTQISPDEIFNAYQIIGDVPEIKVLREKINAANAELQEMTNIAESKAMGTANAFRAENNELHFRGHYDAGRESEDGKTLDIFERADFMEMHAEWREKYGINKDPNIPDDMLRGVDLGEEIQNQLRDIIPESLKDELMLGADEDSLDRPAPGERQQSSRVIG